MQSVQAIKNFLSDIMSFFNPEELTAFFRWLFLNEYPVVQREPPISREGSSVDATPIPPAIETVVSRLQVTKNRKSPSCLFCFGETCQLDVESEETADTDQCRMTAGMEMPKTKICAESLSEELNFGAVTDTERSKDYAIVVVENATIDREDAAIEDTANHGVHSDTETSKDLSKDYALVVENAAIEDAAKREDVDSVSDTKASVCSDNMQLPPKVSDTDSDTDSLGVCDVPTIKDKPRPSDKDADHDVTSTAATKIESTQPLIVTSAATTGAIETPKENITSTASGVVTSPQEHQETDSDCDISSAATEVSMESIQRQSAEDDNDYEINNSSMDSANGITNASSSISFDKASPCTDVPSQELDADTDSRTDLNQLCSAKSKVPGPGDITIHSKKKKRGAKKINSIKVTTKKNTQGPATKKKGARSCTPVSKYSRQLSNAAGITKEETCPLYELCPQLAPGAKIKMHPSSIKPHQVEGNVTFNSPLLSETDFNVRVLQEKICLEFVQLDLNEPKIHGYIRALNSNCEKKVKVVYTVEKEKNWMVVCYSEAQWFESVENSTMDRYLFTIPGLETVGKVSFVIKFNGKVDDNRGERYTIVYDHE